MSRTAACGTVPITEEQPTVLPVRYVCSSHINCRPCHLFFVSSEIASQLMLAIVDADGNNSPETADDVVSAVWNALDESSGRLPLRRLTSRIAYSQLCSIEITTDDAAAAFRMFHMSPGCQALRELRQSCDPSMFERVVPAFVALLPLFRPAIRMEKSPKSHLAFDPPVNIEDMSTDAVLRSAEAFRTRQEAAMLENELGTVRCLRCEIVDCGRIHHPSSYDPKEIALQLDIEWRIRALQEELQRLHSTAEAVPANMDVS